MRLLFVFGDVSKYCNTTCWCCKFLRRKTNLLTSRQLFKMEDVKLKLKFTLIQYFDNSGESEKIRELSLAHRNCIENDEIDIHAPFHCPVHINIINLKEMCGYTCELLILEPNLVQDVITEIIHATLTTILQNGEEISLAQISSPIVLSPLDPLALPSLPTTGLCCLRGTIVEHTLPTKYVRTSQWKCCSDICTSLPPEVHRKLPKVAPLCPHCAGALEEVATMRDYGTVVEVKILENEHLHFLNTHVAESKFVRIEDERGCDTDISLGTEVCVSGYTRIDKKVMEVWSCAQIEYHILEYRANSRIERMRAYLSHSPWAFVRELSQWIGKSLYPDGAFAHLRMGLLLSLASLNSSSPIPILVVAEDTSAPQRLMTEAARLAPKCVTTSLQMKLGGYVKNGWRCSGSMLEASRGVCYLGDWSRYLEKRGQCVRNALESGRIVLENGDGEYLPLRTAIWTYWDKPRKTKNKTHLDTLLKVFGFSWSADVDPAWEENMIEMILNLNPQVRISKAEMEELKSYLEVVTTRPVTLTDGALDLLQKYFVAARAARGPQLPLRSLNPLTSLTEAHARLNQRSLAFPEDALAAVELCETALGPCVMYPNPPKEIWEFGEWLQKYVLVLGLNLTYVAPNTD